MGTNRSLHYVTEAESIVLQSVVIEQEDHTARTT